MPSLATGPRIDRDHFLLFTRSLSAPFSSNASLPSVSLEWAAATLYPSLTWLASRLTSYSRLASRLASIHEGKMLLTDVCNRLNDTSTRKSLDSRARSFRRGDRLRDVPEREPRCHPENGAGPPFSNPTPGGAALDGASPASAEPPAPLPSFIEEETSPALWRALPFRGVIGRAKAGDPASDAPCRALRGHPT